MSQVKVIVRPDGPIQLVGEVNLQRLDGTPIETAADAKGIFLCRCGLSQTKPFCDGSHKRAGWKESVGQETT